MIHDILYNEHFRLATRVQNQDTDMLKPQPLTGTVWSQQLVPQKSPLPRHRKVRPHNSSPLKSVENNADILTNNVEGNALMMVAVSGSKTLTTTRACREEDGVATDIKTSVMFSESYDVHCEIGR